MNIYKEVKDWYMNKGISTEQFFKDNSTEMGREEMMNDFASRMLFREKQIGEILLKDKQIGDNKILDFVSSENAFDKWFMNKIKTAPSKKYEINMYEFSDVMKVSFCDAAKLYLGKIRELYESLDAERITNNALRNIYKKLEKKFNIFSRAVAYYGHKDMWRITKVFSTHACKTTFVESSIDTEWFEEEKQHVSGGIARRAIADVEKLDD